MCCRMVFYEYVYNFIKFLEYPPIFRRVNSRLGKIDKIWLEGRFDFEKVHVSVSLRRVSFVSYFWETKSVRKVKM